MARISTYTNDPTITGADKVLGTDAADNSSKNFTLTSLRDFVLEDGVFDGLIPLGRAAIVGPDNEPRQSQIYETTTGDTGAATPLTFTTGRGVPIPANFVFNLSRDGEGFVITISRFGSVSFPYDIHSFIGKNWIADGYTSGTGQTITAFLTQPFTEGTAPNNQTWSFRTTLTTPLDQDLPSGTAGRALTNAFVSSLNRQTVEIGSGLKIAGNLPTVAPTGANASGTLYTQTATQLGITGVAGSTKFVLEA